MHKCTNARCQMHKCQMQCSFYHFFYFICASSSRYLVFFENHLLFCFVFSFFFPVRASSSSPITIQFNRIFLKKLFAIRIQHPGERHCHLGEGRLPKGGRRHLQCCGRDRRHWHQRSRGSWEWRLRFRHFRLNLIDWCMARCTCHRGASIHPDQIAFGGQSKTWIVLVSTRILVQEQKPCRMREFAQFLSGLWIGWTRISIGLKSNRRQSTFHHGRNKNNTKNERKQSNGRVKNAFAGARVRVWSESLLVFRWVPHFLEHR